MVELHPLLFLELAVCKGSDQGFAEEFGLFSLDVQLAVITLKQQWEVIKILYNYQ